MSLPTIFDPYTKETRVLGSLPSDPRLVASLPIYTGDVLPESELKEFNDFPDELTIKDQNGRGACNGHAAAAVMEQAIYVQQNIPSPPLSGWYPYAILCNGVDRGSNILEAYALLQERGNAPEEFVEYGTINPKKLTNEAHEQAKKYRLEFGETCQSWRQVVSGVMLRKNMNLSICVGRNFNNLDSEGVAGVDRGQGNHAVAVGLGLKFSKKWGWLVLMRNSWSPKWGNKGFCWLSEKHIEAGSYFECFSIKATNREKILPFLANLPKKASWQPKII